MGKINKEKKEEALKQAEISAKDILAEESKEMKVPEEPQISIDRAKKDIEDHNIRKDFLKEKRFQKLQYEAELEDLKAIMLADWDSPEYMGPFIKDDHVCLNSGGDWKPFGPRSKSHLKVDFMSLEDKISQLEILIKKLEEMIIEFDNKHPEIKEE